MVTGLVLYLAGPNVLAGLSILWFRHISYRPHVGFVGMLVDMIVSLIGLLLIVNAIVMDIVLLATVLK